MDPVIRREALLGRPNPAPRRDLLVVLDGPVTVAQPGLTAPVAELAYVPDRVVLDPAAFQRYLLGLGRWSWPGLEDLAVAMIDDVGNEVVPRWARIRVCVTGADGRRHRVVVQERQPLWRGDVPGDVATV